MRNAQRQQQWSQMQQQRRQQNDLRRAERNQRDIFQQQMRQNRQRDFRVERDQRQAYTEPRVNWGQIRRQQAFDAKQQRDILKAQRRADRDYWKSQSRQQRFDDRVYDQPYYGGEYVQPQYSQPYSYAPRRYIWFGDDYSDYDRYTNYTVYTPTYRSYDYVYSDPFYAGYVYDDDYYYDYGGDDGFDWKTLLFRSVISAFLANDDNVGYFDPYPQYSSVYDDGYYGYIPQYRYQPPYYTFGYAPTYAYYEPAAYYGYEQYAYEGVPYDYIAYGSLPYTDMEHLYSGSVAGELIQRALSTGYSQGYYEALAAREYGYANDDTYYDPYLYDQTMYDPYSSSIGNCRRYFSEGYELGYADALNGRDEFDMAGGGDIDLVSMLLTSVLDFRS